MTLKQLEAFYLSATLGSFALAAARVHVTQSTISKRIADLEAWAGVDLFDRTARKAALTDAGQRLLPTASEMLGLQEAARATMEAPSKLGGTCRFGISELGALTWLPRFAARIHSEHPDLALRPHVDLGRQLERQVVRGDLDCAIASGHPVGAHVVSHFLGEVRLAWMSAPGRVAAGTILDADELARHPVITMTEGSALTQLFDAWAARQGLRMERVVASNSLMAIVGLAIADLGLCFLPSAFMQPWVDRGELIRLESAPPMPELPFYFLSRDDDCRTMLRVLRGYVAEAAKHSQQTTWGPLRP